MYDAHKGLSHICQHAPYLFDLAAVVAQAQVSFQGMSNGTGWPAADRALFRGGGFVRSLSLIRKLSWSCYVYYLLKTEYYFAKKKTE